MDKMIKLSSYVDLVSNGDKDDRDKLMSITNYNDLITEPPTLPMFIPCDDDGDPLSNKVLSLKKYQKTLGKIHGEALEHLLDQYEDALENVMFRGWKIESSSEYGTVIHELVKGDRSIGRGYTQAGGIAISFNNKTIEELIESKVKLIPIKSCIKKYSLPENVTA